MKKKKTSYDLVGMAKRFLRWSVVVLVLVAGYFMFVLPLAKNVFISKMVPVSERGTSTSGVGIVAPESRDMGMPASISIYPPMPGGDAFKIDGAYDQKIIKTGNLDLRVDSVAQKLSQVQTIAENTGGFTQNAFSSEDNVGTKYGQVTVRVPSDSFNATMNQIKALALRVISENVSGTDVTQEYSDLLAQLDSLIRIKEQYERLLSQAKTVEEILQVQDRLNSTQQQIDYLQNRITYTTNQTSYATIYVNMTEEKSLSVPVDKFELRETFREGFQTAVRVFQNFISFIIITFFVLVGLIPYLIIIWLLYKLGKYISKRVDKSKKKK